MQSFHAWCLNRQKAGQGIHGIQATHAPKTPGLHGCPRARPQSRSHRPKSNAPISLPTLCSLALPTSKLPVAGTMPVAQIAISSRVSSHLRRPQVCKSRQIASSSAGLQGLRCMKCHRCVSPPHLSQCDLERKPKAAESLEPSLQMAAPSSGSTSLRRRTVLCASPCPSAQHFIHFWSLISKCTLP